MKVPTRWNVVPLISKSKSCMFGMKTLPFMGDLARTADTAVQYASMALKTVSLISHEYGEAAIRLY